MHTVVAVFQCSCSLQHTVLHSTLLSHSTLLYSLSLVCPVSVSQLPNSLPVHVQRLLPLLPDCLQLLARSARKRENIASSHLAKSHRWVHTDRRRRLLSFAQHYTLLLHTDWAQWSLNAALFSCRLHFHFHCYLKRELLKTITQLPASIASFFCIKLFKAFQLHITDGFHLTTNLVVSGTLWPESNIFEKQQNDDLVFFFCWLHHYWSTFFGEWRTWRNVPPLEFRLPFNQWSWW